MPKKIIILLLGLLLFITYSSFSQDKSTNNPVDASELLVNTTIKIIASSDSVVNGVRKTFYSSGTGFFFQFKLKDSVFVPCIVTNKHVIKNAQNGILTFSITINDSIPAYGKKQVINLKNFEQNWILHPDTTVDLAILPINPILDEYKKKGIKLFYLPFDESLIPNDSIRSSISAIENIYMIGYPFGRKDEYNNLPIVRKGITATPFFLDYEGKKEFLADIPVYFGSSGSPIVIYDNIYSNKQGGLMSGRRIVFLGINYATYLRNYEGKLLPKYTFDSSGNNLVAEISIPYNLGIIIKSERLIEFTPLIKRLVGFVK